MSREWKRANGPLQKKIREREIMDAALELRKVCSFSRMTLADIARSASFTRSNLYKYFSCREDLLLALLEEIFLRFVEDTENTFIEGRKHSLKEFSHIWVDLLLQYPQLIELYSLSYECLEKEAGTMALEKWYTALKDGMIRLNRIILTLFPSAEKDDIDEFLYAQTAEIIGLAPLLNLTERQKSFRQKGGLTFSKEYFREILCHAVESLLSPWV
ncbi:MAG: TetR/AcrR family transcriptional regulator [Spirochaetales bacterium]|nr:TetR/AcrR family transcriptional regulator [Spirochaetales bacterium]